MSSPEDPYLDRLQAQIAYRILQGLQQDEILSWFHDTNPNDPDSDFWAALAGAEQQAENTLAFRRLGQGEQFGLLFPQGSDIFQEHEVFLRVGIPIPGQGTLWTTSRVTPTILWTRAEIEAEAIAIGQTRVMPGMGLGHMNTQQFEEIQVEMIRGLIL